MRHKYLTISIFLLVILSTFAIAGDTYVIKKYTIINGSGSTNETDPLWRGNASLVYLKSNPLGYYNSTTLPASNEIDPLWSGNQSLYYLASNPDGYISSYTETEPLWIGNTSLVYFKNNLLGFYNSSTLPNTAYQNSAVGWTNTTTTSKTSLSINGTSTVFFPSLSTAGVGDQYICISPTTGELKSGTTCVASAQRFKQNVTNNTHGMDWINLMRPVNFTWIYNNNEGLGFIAEEMNNISPLLVLPVSSTNNTVFGINFQVLSGVVVKALQEHDSRFNTLLSTTNGSLIYGNISLKLSSETDPLWSGNTSLYYLKSNPLGYYNITTLPASNGGGLSSIVSPNSSIVVEQNTTHANLSVSLSYLAANCAAITGSASLCDGDDASGGGGITKVYVSNNQTSTSATVITNISGLHMILSTMGNWTIWCYIDYKSSAATTGLVLAVSANSSVRGTDYIRAETTHTTHVSAAAMLTPAGASALNVAMIGTGSSGVNTTSSSTLRLLRLENKRSMNVSAAFRSEVAGSTATIIEGSYCTYEKQ